MAEGRQRSAWQHTSMLLAVLANCHRDPQKTRAFQPADFDPFAPPAARPKVRVSVLKDVFIDHRMPGYGGPGGCE